MDQGTKDFYKYVMSLNNTQLQAIVAKKLGYRPTAIDGFVKVYVRGDIPNDVIAFLPNWPVTIKDAFELEEDIPEVEQSFYANILSYIVTEERLSQGCMTGNQFHLLHATARQRCMAWVIYKEMREELDVRR